MSPGNSPANPVIPQVWNTLTIDHVDDPELRAVAFIIKAMSSHEVCNPGRQRIAAYIADRFIARKS